MKIDFSTILWVIIAVIPGLFAQRSRNLVAPRSLEAQGNSAEFAELVALGIATHCVLAYFAALVLLLGGFAAHLGPLYFFRKLDSFRAGPWCALHVSGTVLIAAGYFFFSCFVSYMMGFLYGVWRLQSPLPKTWLGKGSWLARVGIRGILAERPIIYEVLNPEMRDGVQKLVFVELEMKSDVGFYSGQLDQFAIVKDEQPHKPIFLINVWWKKNRAEQYEQLESDGLMVDLADVAILQTKQVADGAQQGTPS